MSSLNTEGMMAGDPTFLRAYHNKHNRLVQVEWCQNGNIVHYVTVILSNKWSVTSYRFECIIYEMQQTDAPWKLIQWVIHWLDQTHSVQREYEQHRKNKGNEE